MQSHFSMLSYRASRLGCMRGIVPVAACRQAAYGTQKAKSAVTMLAKSFQVPTIRLKDSHLLAKKTEEGGEQLEVVAALQQRVQMAPLFYRNAPIVLDVEEVRDSLQTHTMKDLVAQLAALELVVVGVTGATATFQEKVKDLSIPVLSVPKTHGSLKASSPAATLKEEKKAEAKSSGNGDEQEAQGERVEVAGTVRSGQQAYAKGRGAQLVVMGNVSSGAEVLSDGDIVVFGTLSGRALAGVSGDQEARIYAGRLHAELISVADVFCTGEQLPQEKRMQESPVLAVSRDGKLQFETVNKF